MDTWFVRTDEERRRLEITEGLSKSFAETAARYDETGTFPHEHFDALRKSGYPSWTVPRAYGGPEISLYEMLLHQEQLARGDGSTALAIGWHMGVVLNLRASHALPESVFQEICEAVVARGALINSCASEPATGSPSRGGRPETTAVRVDGGYVLNGRKTFSTLSPELDFVLTTAGIQDSPNTGEFLIFGRDIEVVETWNVMGMRGTGSHDIVLKDVFVPDHHLVAELAPRQKSPRTNDGGGWQLHIPACYLGIALNARDFAVQYAANYQPNSLPHPIVELDHIQNKLGQVELKLLTARTFLYDLARRWDEASPGQRMGLKSKFGAAKTYATNTAIEVVDLCMRVAGARSLSRNLVLERLYRDVRAGLHNPPMDDVTYKLLTLSAAEEHRR